MSGVAAQIARLKRAFPKQEIPQGTFDVYVAELAAVPPGLLEDAVTGIIRTEQWFPTVAAIRAACAELTLALPSEPDALSQIEARIAWARDRSDLLTGSDAPAVHPLVRQALTQVGGFSAFKQSDSGVVKGQFGRIYRELRAAAVLEAQLSPALEAGAPQVALDP